MPALNFTVFVDKVEDGSKRQTIRKPRKRPIKMGDMLHLYADMRTKACRKLGVAECERTPIEITINYDHMHWGMDRARWEPHMVLPQQLAKADGFEDYEEMVKWFAKTHGLPFTGVVIQWGELRHGC